MELGSTYQAFELILKIWFHKRVHSLFVFGELPNLYIH